MTDQNCIFCKILAGDIPSAVVYEDDDFKVILDVGPAAKGHMLILPKEHYADIMAMPEDLVAKAFILAKKMATKMESVLGCDGINVVQNNGEAAGQTVRHYHMHIIPRYTGDTVQVTWKQQELPMEEIQKAAQAVQKALEERE